LTAVKNSMRRGMLARAKKRRAFVIGGSLLNENSVATTAETWKNCARRFEAAVKEFIEVM
jgi:hypothetical protein